MPAFRSRSKLKRIGLDCAGDRPQERIGDNWRLRYRGLKLHNKTPVNHLRYLPFPTTFPDYIPKDKIANWLESYVDIMEVDFWTAHRVRGRRLRRGLAALDRAADARRRVRARLRPKHIVLATSVSGTPNIPEIAGIENFKGEVLHSSRFKAGRQWARPARDRVRHRHQRA